MPRVARGGRRAAWSILSLIALCAGWVGGSPAAQGQADAISLEVTTQCSDGDAIFRIRNNGGKWPDKGQFTVVRLSDRAIVLQRDIRMGEGQRASFKVKAATGDSGGRLGLFVEPSWYSREFTFDAVVECGG